ncbi:MAG: hypothetical protein Q9227_003521 [Pyrenula ochraceoflavens]
MPSSDERTPLLRSPSDPEPEHNDTFHQIPNNPHSHFCVLVGVPPSNVPSHAAPSVGSKTLYGRVKRQHATQHFNYVFTATLSNMLLLSQVVLSAALTALGASESSHVLITIFGVLNTIIAGLVAYLKSRGQPMRARMYRDDLERVVDEIENSEIMWLGISKDVHGYNEIAVDDEVTVRSEVARLTRLYDKAVRTNSANNPDMYMAGAAGEAGNVALRSKSGQPVALPGPAVAPTPGTVAQAPAAAPPTPVGVAPEDESPATAPPKENGKSTEGETAAVGDAKKDAVAPAMSAPAKVSADPNESATAGTSKPDPKTEGKPKEETNADASSALDAAPSQRDPDESPATAPPKHSDKAEKKEDTTNRTKPKDDKVKNDGNT